MIERLTEALRADFKVLRGQSPQRVELDFYPYARLVNTLRFEDGILKMRLSDILLDAPETVIEALMSILLHKLFRKRVPALKRRYYSDYVNRPEILGRIQEVRRKRGRKQINAPKGEVFNLSAIYQQLNADYFQNQLQIDHIGWSPGRSRRTLGHFDAAHNAIVVNSRLDSPAVPEFVVAFIVYHEMLHAYFGEEVSNGRRLVHHRRFKEAERAHPDYRRAQDFIRTHFARGRRR